MTNDEVLFSGGQHSFVTRRATPNAGVSLLQNRPSLEPDHESKVHDIRMPFSKVLGVLSFQPALLRCRVLKVAESESDSGGNQNPDAQDTKQVLPRDER